MIIKDGFAYMENTAEFKFQEGDCIGAWFLSYKPGVMVSFTKENELMLLASTVDENGEIKKMCIVKGCPELMKVDEEGREMFVVHDIKNYGFVDLATEIGVKRYKTLVPVFGCDKNHFLMGDTVARKI